MLGAGGFIGTNLISALLQVGADVTAFGRRPRYETAMGGVAWIDGEFADADRVAQAIRGQEIVFHLLGGSVPAESNRDPSSDVIGSLLPSVRLIEACSASGVRRIVFASSGGTIYGPGPHQPVAEDAPTDPITAYGINKLAVEKYLGLSRHLRSLDPIVLRIANPYGPYQRGHRPQGLIGTAIAHALANKPITIWGDGQVVRDYLYVDDAISAMISASSYRGREWVFNVGSGEGRTVSAVIEDVCAVTGISVDQIRYLPSRPADIAYNVLDIGLIAREIGWQPLVPFDKGLAATVDWWRTYE